MSKYKIAVFDLDGTILDTLEDLKESLDYALSVYHFSTHSINEVRSYVGNGIRRLLERALPDGTPAATMDEVHSAFSEFYSIHCMDNTHPYPGICSLLQTLRENGYSIAVLSSKPETEVSKLVFRYFEGLFDVVIGERPALLKKPAPDGVNEIIKCLAGQKEDVIYIGDSEVDLATARNAGVDCISVEWGFRDHDFLVSHGATTLVDSTDTLLQLLI